ncbi:cobalamin biosynthesis protein CobD [Rhodoblastus acidophilus]|uniref:Cobalamin biosynthesis protein CobD n=1 Tax=Rhodoblastus acidophilus TaxID=1074 RepID=A0A6N8DK98_RHOAC|nr:adenosylcobinamide-phosphate synthase CbiB [Rhodoblastus acidophilus]MCW2272750.1 adenosylcobinamide-phosphate synthase [Rhodoblastus acidophilus]MTV29661.1 cobalamin biosynthesis protein CobD [Rhodoblastus acidophilus]
MIISAFTLALALAALLLEGFFSYPPKVYAAIGHPVGWIGALIKLLDDKLNASGATPDAKRNGGIATIAIIVVVTGAVAYFFSDWAGHGIIGFVLLAAVASSLVAQRSLYDHVEEVARALQLEGLPAAREKVGKLVGRDTAELDEAGVARAAIESLAENFSDGVVAPTFYTVLFGVFGGAIYKAVNTADSMIGHKNEKYRVFGEATAKLDDLLNLPASRISAVWLAIAAALTPGADWRGAKDAVLRDASRHRSPNAGWPEAAVAGALGYKLAGPRVYNGETIEDATMGNGRSELNFADVKRALTLYRKACFVQIGVLAALLLLVIW